MIKAAQSYTSTRGSSGATAMCHLHSADCRNRVIDDIPIHSTARRYNQREVAQSSEFGFQGYCPTLWPNRMVQSESYWMCILPSRATWIVFVDGSEKCRTIVPSQRDKKIAKARRYSKPVEPPVAELGGLGGV